VRALPPGVRVVAIDIEPMDISVQKQDFFRYEPPCFERDILVVGNPPFGQRGALAIRFLNRAMEYASMVAFILPRSFRKHTFLNRVDQQFHLVDQFDCSDFVLPGGEAVEVKCVFQIWQRAAVSRPRIELPATHVDFEMKHFHLSRTTTEEREHAARNFDFAIAQVGSNFRPRCPADVDSGSYWFIKAKRPEVEAVFRRLDFSFLDGQNTAHKSLSKRDIIKAYCEAL
jgi:hypothetical protein